LHLSTFSTPRQLFEDEDEDDDEDEYEYGLILRPLKASKPADIGLSGPCLNLFLLLIGPVVPISSIKKLNQQELP